MAKKKANVQLQKRMRQDIYRALSLRITLYSALYWVLFWLLNSVSGTPFDYAYQAVWSFMYGLSFQTDSLIGFWIVYFAGIVAILLVYLRRQVAQMGMLSSSIGILADEHAPLPVFSDDMREVSLQLEQARQSILKSRSQAAEAEQRKNDLVVYLAHDLKTPLTSVIGYLSLLEEAPEMPREQRAKYTGIALKKAYRLEDLVNEFFEITRFNLSSLELERGKVNLSVLLCQLVDEFYPVFLERDLRCEAEIEPGIEVLGDADKLARVFDNLLRNAVSYSYPGTAIRLSAYRGEQQASILVRNEGPEITQQNLDRIFEKFFRADASRGTRQGGAGLGLAIAKQIISLHGGRIAAASNPKYTEFSVTLPSADLALSGAEKP